MSLLPPNHAPQRSGVSSVVQTYFCTLLLSLLVVGCASKIGRSPLDPSEGWKVSRSQDTAKLPAAIVEDYQRYIAQLPLAKRSFIGGIRLYEDGTGRRAVDIEQGINGTYWRHVLFYDHDSKRVRVVKYVSGGYSS